MDISGNPDSQHEMLPGATDVPVTQGFDWQVAVFCQNERERIGLCIKAIDAPVTHAGIPR
jgi:hypothetical protein